MTMLILRFILALENRRTQVYRAVEFMSRFGPTSAMTFSAVVSIAGLRESLSADFALLAEAKAYLMRPGGCI